MKLVIFVASALFLLSAMGIVYLVSRIRKFNFVKKTAKERKAVEITVSFFIIAAVSATLWLTLGFLNLCVIILHLIFVWMLCDFAVWIIRKITGKTAKYYIAGIIAILLTVSYMSFGYYIAENVVVTEYNIKTRKDVEPMKIAMITDIHIGTTFDGDEFERHVEKINSLGVDAVLIVGDFVDNSSSENDIIEASEKLGMLTSKYGTYFTFGNHDDRSYGENGSFGGEELAAVLAGNGVTVLEDEAVSLGDTYTLIGRKDRSDSSHVSAESLTANIDKNRYIIDMNHQPYDYENEQAAGMDLVLSGHTHGGQLLLIKTAIKHIGGNKQVYGIEKRGETNYIVSSGISNWGINFKTGCVSEIVVINVSKEWNNP